MSGRKNKYQTHIEPHLQAIKGYLRSGHTEESIAARYGVGTSTWHRYKTVFKEFRELVIKATQDSMALVVNALFKRATGYEYDEIQTEITDQGQGQGKEQGQPGNQRRVIKKTTKQVAPDTGAAIFLLINRDPEHWQNRQDIRHSGEIKNQGVLMVSPPLDKDEWEKFYEQKIAPANANANGNGGKKKSQT